MRPKTDLRPTQQALITDMYQEDRLRLVVPMGGGKTAAVLTTVRELIDDGEARCALVIAPKKVAQLVWPAETQEWEHLRHLRVTHVAGTPKQRLTALLDGNTQVFVVGVDNTQWLVTELAKLPEDHRLFDILVIDEDTKFKSPKSKRAKALFKIVGRFKQRWQLTGTPRPGGYIDLFTPLKLLTAGKLWGKSFYKWRQENFFPADYQGYVWAVHPHLEKQLVADAASVSVTVSEMPELPPYTPVMHWLDLPDDALEMYAEMERDLIARHWDKGKETWIDAANRAVAQGKLSQLAQGFMYHTPSVVGTGGEAEREVKWVHDVKLAYLAELLETLEDNAIISYEYQEDRDRLFGLLGDVPHLGSGVKDADTLRYEREWNEGKHRRMLLHPASAGHGLNLAKGGNQFIVYGMIWSAEMYDQMLKRVDRPGQSLPTFGHHLLVRNTVDEVKYHRVINKMSEQEAFRLYLRKV
jgi:hypothetical protein